MITEYTGDIFTSSADVIAHGVNTRGVMGAGIAKQVRERYPDVYAAYVEACRSGSLRPGGLFVWHVPAADPGVRWVANCASQVSPGADASYYLLTESCAELLYWAKEHEYSVAFPQIGCGIGGLNWDIVRQILAGLARAFNVDVELWTYEHQH